MRDLYMLMLPYFFSMRNRFRFRRRGDALRVWVLGLLGVVFWVGIFFLFFKVLKYFSGVEFFGPVLARKLLSMIFITFFFLLIFSNIVTALSTFFLSDDMSLLVSAPMPPVRIYGVKFLETIVSSSWMIVIFAMPVFAAYAVVYRAEPVFFLQLIGVLIPFLVIPAAVGIAVTMMLVQVFPARRVKDVLFVMGLLFFVILFILFRVLRPEQLVDPDAVEGLLGYVVTLQAPTNIFLPTHWASEALAPFLFPDVMGNGSFFLYLLVSTGAAMVVLGNWVSEWIFFDAWSKAQESRKIRLARLRIAEKLIWKFPAPVTMSWRALMIKDIKAFFRDTTQWSQLLLLLALVIVYVYNFSVLPLEKIPMPTFFLQHIIAFVNLALAAFVLSAVAARFVYPSISLEGRAFWILQTGPIAMKSLLGSKFWLGLVPLLTLSEILVIVTNYFLHVNRFMMGYSILMVFLLTLGITSMGVGFGAIYPRFTVDNPAKISTGFGGLVYMIVCMLYIGAIVYLSAIPAYLYLQAQAGENALPAGFWIKTGIAALLIFIIQTITIILPLHLGTRRLENREGLL